MKSKNIFIGTIKECKNLYWYERCGDEQYVSDFKIGRTQIGTIHKYVDIIDKEAILIRINEKKYIWINLLTKYDEFLVNVGIGVKTISTFPTSDHQLFVDEQTLKPYFKDENHNLSVKKIKSLVLKR